MTIYQSSHFYIFADLKKTPLMKNIIVFLSLTFFFIACQPDKKVTPPPPAATAPPMKKIKIPKFDSESAYNFIAEQVAFGPRIPNTEGHKACKNYLVNKLKEFGATVIEQDFKAKAYTGTTLNGTNIIGQYNPTAKKRILLAAHWDTRHITDNDPDESQRNNPVMGADDGASGVGVLLEIARNLGSTPIENIGIDIIFFDAEDHGETGSEDNKSWCLGSRHWANNPHVTGYRANYGILLDMVGGKNARFPIEGVSAKFAPDVVRKVWKLAQGMGFGDYFSEQNVSGITDDHLFVNQIAKIPMIDIINLPTDTEQTFVKHWHTNDDTMENIDKRTLRAVGQVVMATLYNEAMGRM